jgi:putative alpha-1,2-mannosidase
MISLLLAASLALAPATLVESPDTPSQNAGGGYEYGDSTITGFSLTHLSEPGCSVLAISR